MWSRLVELCLRQKLAVLAATTLFILWASYAFGQLSIEAFPDPTDTQVQIIVSNPGQPAEELERKVALPIERALNGTPGLVRVRSINLFGLSYLTLTFRDGIDANSARLQVLERIRLVDLPSGVRAELGSLSTPIGEIYRYTLASDDRDPLRLRTTQDWTVRPRLLQVDGVADVVSFGGLSREIQVRADPIAMASKSVTMSDLAQAIESASENASGGVIERGSEQLVIRSEGLFVDQASVGSTAVATRGGTPIFVSDLASVQVGWSPRQGVAARANDSDVVEGIVLMRRNENPSRVLKALRAAIADLVARELPSGTHIVPFYDRTDLVGATLRTVGRNLIEGAILVAVVLYVFLVDLRAALIVASLIPLSLLSAFLYLHLRGMSANLLSMGALDFGVIVDGGVVIMEAILVRLRGAPGTPQDVEPAIHRAMSDVVRPTVLALLIIVAAYIPLLLLERVEGRLFGPMAQTVVAGLVGSLIFSVTLLPVLAALGMRRSRHRESWVLLWASRRYRPLLALALRRPLGIAVVSAGAVTFAVFLLARRGTEFLPELNEGALYVTVTLPENASLTEGRRLMPAVASVIDRLPEVESYLSQLGRPEDGTDPKLSNNLEIFVRLKPAADWPPAVRTLGQVMERMASLLKTIPGVEFNLSQPIRDNVNESIAGQQGQVALKLRSNDLTTLQTASAKAMAALGHVPGIADLGTVKFGMQPQVQVTPRRERMGRFGLTMEAVQGFLSTALGGRQVGELWDGERVFPIVLRLPDSARHTIEQLSTLRIPTPSGALVPLGQVADISTGSGRSAITRENGRRYVGIRMNVRGRDLGGFVDDARREVAAAVPASMGVEIEWGGEFESKERAMSRLMVVLPIALIITLALLFAIFRSVPVALVVLSNVPFALIGGAVALWIIDMPLSIAAAVGFIALVGQAALNGVLVVSAIEKERREGADLQKAIVNGAEARLRAVLMTASLAALGLIPASVSRAMGAEMQRPMAAVIVGGTLSAALFTLLVLPVSYQTCMRVLRRT